MKGGILFGVFRAYYLVFFLYFRWICCIILYFHVFFSFWDCIFMYFQQFLYFQIDRLYFQVSFQMVFSVVFRSVFPTLNVYFQGTICIFTDLIFSFTIRDYSNNEHCQKSNIDCWPWPSALWKNHKNNLQYIFTTILLDSFRIRRNRIWY